MVLNSKNNIVDVFSNQNGFLVYRNKSASETMIYKSVQCDAQAVQAYLLNYEYQLLKKVSSDHIVKPVALNRTDRGYILVMNDIGGSTLESLYAKPTVSKRQFIFIAMQIAKAVRELHACRLVHNNLTLSNIIYNPKTRQINILDFSQAVMRNAKGPDLLEVSGIGNPEFAAPERISRENWLPDIRSDLYAMGIIFYKIASGRLPFSLKEPSALLHAHLAVQPDPVDMLATFARGSISTIIMRLLEKNPDIRFGSAHEVFEALIQCRDQLADSGSEKIVEPRKDFLWLGFGDVLYGREKMRQHLADKWHRVTHFGEKHIVSVAGSPGVGKTAFLHNFCTLDEGIQDLAIWGKFDQLDNRIPYSAIKTAFQTLLSRILGKRENEFKEWKHKLQTVLGGNGRLIIDILPVLEKIIGPQPPVSKLQPEAEKNRFAYVFSQFIKVLTSAKAPLVLIIDDLQWADTASMEIIRNIILGEDIAPLFLVVAYRTGEMIEAHPWQDLVLEIKNNSLLYEHLVVDPLTKDQTSLMTCEALQTQAGTATAFCAEVFKKTMGNPLVIQEFLLALERQKVLFFDSAKKAWEWDMNRVRSTHVSDTAAVIVRERMNHLSKETLDALNSASCFGGVFDIRLLAAGHQTSENDILDLLLPALREGMIRSHNTVSWDQTARAEKTGDPIPGHLYSFTHDSIQKAAFDFLNQEKREEKQWQFGYQCLKYHENRPLGEDLFTVTNLLNAGNRHCTGRDKKNHLALLNMRCGEKALASAAYQTAFQYFEKGVSKLEDIAANGNCSVWETDPDLCFDLYKGWAKASFLIGSFDKLDTIFRKADSFIRDPVNKAAFYEMKVGSLFARERMEESVAVAMHFVKDLGLRFPKKPKMVHLVSSVLKTRFRLHGRTNQSIVDLPLMKNREKLAALRGLSSAILACYSFNPELMVLIILKVIRICLKYGIAEAGVFAFAGYGLILCGWLNRIAEGQKYGKLALALLERHGMKSIEGRTVQTVHNCVLHWNKPLREVRPPLLKTYQVCLETGDHGFACVCASSYCETGFHCGESLDGLRVMMTKFEKVIRRLNQEAVLYSLLIYRQALENLAEGGQNPWRLDGEHYQIERDCVLLESSNNSMALFEQYYLSMVLCFFYDKVEDAAGFAISARKHLETVISLPCSVSFIFYETMTLLSCLEISGKSENTNKMKQLQANLKLMKRWVKACPENIRHKIDLMKARFLYRKNKVDEAGHLFEQAVNGAVSSGYLNDEAVVREYAGQFYLTIGKESNAREMLTGAHTCYLKWGAVAKARHMLTRYPSYIFKTAEPAGVVNPIVPHQDIHQSMGDDMVFAHNMDIYAILEASRQIARETRFDVLMVSLGRSMLINSGATKAVVLLYSGNRLKVEVSAESSPVRVRLTKSRSLENYIGEIPEVIVNYVARTNEIVVLEKAHESDRFSEDPYVRKKNPASILCSPIFNKNMTAGVLYLENELITGAFTIKRMKILNILISQAVVSIENSRLFETLDRERRKKEAARGEIMLQKRRIEDMSAQLVDLEEKERKIIADDLHDSVSQILSMCLLEMHRLAASMDEEKKKNLTRVTSYISKVLDEVRSLTFQLSPGILYDLGLTAAIEWLTEDFQKRTGIQIEFVCEKAGPVLLAEPMNVQVYRAAREILMNIVKHSDSKTAKVNLATEDNTLILTVEDQGKGFSIDTQLLGKDGRQKGYGLWRVQEKIQMLNGQVTVKTRPGEGTLVLISVPMINEEKSDRE